MADEAMDLLWRQIFGQQAGLDIGGIERTTFNNAKDFERMLEGYVAAMRPGGQDPAAFEDVETGRTQINLPSRPLFQSYSQADPESMEARAAFDVDRNMTPSEMAIQMRAQYSQQEGAPDLDEFGSLLWENDPQSQARKKEFESELKAVQDIATSLWSERTDYNSQVAQLNPQARAALDEGRTWYEEVTTERSAAAKKYDEAGLPTPVDQWKQDDFSSGFSARQADNSQFEDLYRQVQGMNKDARTRFEEARRPTGNSPHRAESARWSAMAARPEMDSARELFGQAHTENQMRSARGRAQDHGTKAIIEALNRAGRTPFTDAMQARMGTR